MSEPTISVEASQQDLPLIESAKFSSNLERIECRDVARSYLYNYKTKGRRGFLQDQTTASTCLPRALPTGLPYVANFISFRELVQRGAIQSCIQNEVDFSVKDLQILYEAKCVDQELVPSWEREMRFMELISANCRGKFFCLKECGFGPMCAGAIAHILSRNRKYTILDLSGNRLQDEGACSIASLIKVNRSLVHVGLRSNYIGHIGGVALAQALLENNTVVSLDLGAHSGINGNHIATAGAEAIGAMLRANKVLSHLNLSCNGLGVSGVSFIAAGLNGNYSLKHLNVSVNNLGYAGIETLAPVLETTCITHLSLQRNAMGDNGGMVLFEAIAAAIENGEERIEFLNLETNDLGEKTAKAIQRVLASSTTLKKLRLSSNNFGESSKHIMEGLAENKCLLLITLSFCGIRETDGAAIGAALTANNTLQHLDLSNNKLKDAGSKCILEAMKTNEGLLSLNLACNKITDDGGKAIALCLASNRTLLELNLRRNCMSNTTGELLDDYLRSNNTLEKMDVTYNDFRYHSLMGQRATLARNVERNKNLVVPKLKAEIEGLSFKSRELSQAEDEIEMERRIIKDRSEQLLRRSEEARVMTEKARREIVDLEKSLTVVRARLSSAEEVLRRTEERVSNEMSELSGRKTSMEARIGQEKERADRMQHEIERMRRQLKQLEEAEAIRLKPLLLDLSIAEADRGNEAKECQYEANRVAALALQRKELEKKLGLSLPVAGGGAAATKSKKRK
ncbi:ribonuclease inhibitor-like protein [Trypanosoma rangeli]|uniref:Ribonuclease inhibitor-like protein n=1 Tax=Trypanosoma rangeli TaxID=5698 RepID=A0A422NEU0_TRYRA|nr:ribonuclease inhibitor-like protein [Trypanosoma rangeli]RNF03985.1 ribonuclease inhibitor-like protein [Trypanosoma rangeli]|eukprot:RNF03985.1 ribonuclease inhibitor-like protein [Trypanosoma rangeli]